MPHHQKIYECSIQVRGYEIDGFGHVNNSVYLNYLEHARWMMLNEEGLTLEKFRKWQRWPVIARIEIDYLKPTFMHDTLEVRTRMIEYRKSSFLIEQEIFRKNSSENQKVAVARIKSVVIDETGKPAGLPDEMTVLWKAHS